VIEPERDDLPLGWITCEACDGLGHPTTYTDAICEACEGAGVIWGVADPGVNVALENDK